MQSFKEFIVEDIKLVPSELNKLATAGPYKNQFRTDILADLIKKQIPLELLKGKDITIANVPETLEKIAQFKKDGKPFEMTGVNGRTITSSMLKKSKYFGGGAGAGGGTKQTAIGESAQCLWMAAMLDIGSAMPIEAFTDDVLKKAFKNVSVGSTSLQEMLEIDDSWKLSSYLTAQYAIKEQIIERGMRFHRDDKFMKAIYSASKKAFKNSDIKPLPDDKWNPGDIWAEEIGFSLGELDTTSAESLNDSILDLYLQTRLVGISLKKISKAVASVEKNVERPPMTADLKFSNGQIKSTKGSWSTTKANFIYFRGGDIDLRANSAFGSHKAEIQQPGSRGGGVGWGPMTDAAKRVYGNPLPKNADIVKEAKIIVKGDSKAISKFTSMLQVYDKTISEDQVIEEIGVLGKNAAIWVHGKLGGLYVLDLIKRGGVKADQFITQIVNYAGSATAESSAYVVLKNK